MGIRNPKKIHRMADAVGMACVIASFIIPIFMIAILVRLLSTHGVPVWYLWVHGALTALTIVQIVVFLRAGLMRAIRNYRSGRDREAGEG